MDAVAEVGIDTLSERVRREAFAFVAGTGTDRLLGGIKDSSEWRDFASSWDRLCTDTYLAERGLRRRRRHAVYEVDADGSARRLAHQPHFQEKTYNHLQGGLERWFEPLEPAVGAGPVLTMLLGFAARLFGTLSPRPRFWRAEVHQFRIEASGAEGLPTPEGAHRDGVDYVLVSLIQRTNVRSGVTSIYRDGRSVDSFTLRNPLDTVFIDDARVRHGVTAIHELDPTQPAFRDVLVITLQGTQSADSSVQSTLPLHGNR